MLYKFLEICELAVGDDEDASSEAVKDLGSHGCVDVWFAWMFALFF